MAFDKFARDALVQLKTTVAGMFTSSAYRPTPEAGSDLPNGAYYTSVDATDGLQYRYQRTAGGTGYTRGRLVYSKADVGLPEVDNTSDVAKAGSGPIASAIADAKANPSLTQPNVTAASAAGVVFPDGVARKATAIPVLGAVPGQDAYDLIMAAAAQANAAGGGEVYLPFIGGVGYCTRKAIVIPYRNVRIRYADHIRLTATTIQPGEFHSVFVFTGDLVSTPKVYLEGAQLIADRPGLVVDGNARNVTGYTHTTGQNHHAVLFLACKKPYARHVYAYNGLVGGVTFLYCPGNSTYEIEASDTRYDNGICAIFNAEHIIPLADDRPDGWGGGFHIRPKAWACANHGIGTFGAVGQTLIDPDVADCGNNLVTPAIAGPAGGINVEQNEAQRNFNMRHLVIGGRVRRSYGFAYRTNSRGSRVKGLLIEGTRIPTNYTDAATPIWGSDVFIQNNAADCEIDVRVRDSERYGIRIAGGDKALVTAAIAGTTMTVSAVASGTLSIGDQVGGVNIVPGTVITALGTGTGGVGTYIVNVPQVAASAAVNIGVYPGVRLKVAATRCKFKAIEGIGFDSVIVDPGSTFEECGDPTITSNQYVISLVNLAANNNGGIASVSGEFLYNHHGPANVGSVAVADISRGISGVDNCRAWATPFHAIYLNPNPNRVLAGNIILSDKNGKQARIVQGGCSRLIIDRPSILGDKTNNSVPNADISAVSVLGKPDTAGIFVSYAATLTPNVTNGFTQVTAMTGALTINAPTTSTPISLGDEFIIAFVQDATGGRIITWNPIWKAVTLTGAGTAGQKAVVTFKYDGSAFVQTGSTGWYS